MREILFRGKRLDTGEWVYGNLLNVAGLSALIVDETIHGDFNRHAADVDPETVGQYTGLLDKNGVKIFEGDILREDKYFIAIVIYHCGRFMTVLSLDKKDICIGVTRWDECEVIGSIHDNPELLEENRNA